MDVNRNVGYRKADTTGEITTASNNLWQRETISSMFNWASSNGTEVMGEVYWATEQVPCSPADMVIERHIINHFMPTP